MNNLLDLNNYQNILIIYDKIILIMLKIIHKIINECYNKVYFK